MDRFNRNKLVLATAWAVISLGSVGGLHTEAAPAAATTAPAIDGALQAAIDRLANDDATIREAAQDELVQIGSNAVEPLRKLISTTTNLEQRINAQAALARIVEFVSSGPTIISLKMDNATVPEIIAELSKKSGMPLTNQTGNDTSRKFTIDLPNQPFWSVIRELNRITGLNVQMSGRGESLSIISGGGYDLSAPAVVDGPFMILAQSINLNSNVQLAQQNNINRHMSIQFLCFTEPKLLVSQRPYTVRLTEVIDDQGKSLALPNQQYDSFGGDTQSIWSTTAQLAIPDSGSQKIVKLAGSLRMMVATKSMTLEIPDVLEARNVTRSADGQSVTIKDVTVEGDQVRINLTYTFPNTRNIQAQNILQSIRLLDAEGTSFGQPAFNGTKNPFDYSMVYNRRSNAKAPGAPAKLVWVVPTEMKPLDCTFEFKNLPLP